MKIYRRIFGKISDESMKSVLEGILKEDLGLSYFSKDLDESSVEYNRIKEYVEIFNLEDGVIGTEFTEKEILAAEVLCFIGGRPFAYPQPEEPKYLENTYVDSCYSCGAFGEQKADFVIKKDPNLKLNSLVSLHWVFGELFSERTLYKEFFKQLGLDMRLVRLNKKTEQAESVVQIVLPRLDKPLKIENLDFTTCQKCARKKYIPTTIGFFPMPEQKNFSIISTSEFFGSAHSADHRILVSNSIMKEMLKLKIAKQHQFVPCK